MAKFTLKKKPEQINKQPFTLDKEELLQGGDETRVWATLHRTVQIKEFHPIGTSIGAATNVREGETMADALSRLQPTIQSKVISYVEKFKEALKKN